MPDSQNRLKLSWLMHYQTVISAKHLKLNANGAPRPMKMGTTPSRFPYDAEARDTLQSASLRCSAI
jgi:hypothetical protein